MKTDDLLDALGEADPTYIQEAEDVRYLGARKKHFYADGCLRGTSFDRRFLRNMAAV